jgi:hypothetical protein
MLRYLYLVVVLSLILVSSGWSGINDGLAGYWPMDAGNGDKVADASGKGNDGVAKDCKWVDGKFSKALEFNGTTSIVDIPYFPDVTPNEGVTMSAWVLPTDTTRGCVIGQFEGYGLALFDNLQLKSVIWGDDWVSTQTLTAQECSHIAMTWDVKNNERNIFVNGKRVDNKKGFNPIPNVQNDLGIGLWVGWPAEWGDDVFMGIIDEVKLWARTLTDDEIGQSLQPATVEAHGKLATTWGNVKI